MELRDLEIFTNYYSNLTKAIDNIDKNQLRDVLNLLRETRNKNGRVFLMGNGGSAASISHASNDLIKFAKLRCFPITDTSVITAMANDEPDHFESIFKKQLEVFLDPIGSPNDIVLVLSGSGNSPNIVKALKYAKDNGIKTIGFLGRDGGQALQLCDQYVLIKFSENIDDYQVSQGIIEDIHLSLLTHSLGKILSQG
jgi:D-sedoheptulose 7-phosphate isomerase